MPPLFLGDIFPNFTAETTQGKINFYEWQEDKWVVLFSHPADFTPICTTELGKMAVHEAYFANRDVKLLGHSIDSLQSHLKWVEDMQAYYREIPGEFPYPIIADPDGELAVALGMIKPEFRLSKDHRETARALYIIDPKHVLRLTLTYPNSTGRNINEILRVIDSLQLTDTAPQCATPCNWQPGEDVMVLPNITQEELDIVLSDNMNSVEMSSGLNYMRSVPVKVLNSVSVQVLNPRKRKYTEIEEILEELQDDMNFFDSIT